MVRPSRMGCAVIGALSAALLLSGCGRKGPLDPPPSASVEPADAAPGAAAARPAAQPIEYGPDGKPLAPRGAKRKLPLDWLID